MDFRNWAVPVTEREILQSTCRHNLPKLPRWKSYHCYRSRVWSHDQWPCRYRRSWENYFGFCWKTVAGGFLLGTLVEGEKKILKKDIYNSKHDTSYVFRFMSNCGITYLVFAGCVECIDNRSSGYPTEKYMKGEFLNNSTEKLTDWKWCNGHCLISCMAASGKNMWGCRGFFCYAKLKAEASSSNKSNKPAFLLIIKSCNVRLSSPANTQRFSG